MSTEELLTIAAIALFGLGFATFMFLTLTERCREARRLHRIALLRDEEWRAEMREIRDACRQHPSEWKFPDDPS